MNVTPMVMVRIKKTEDIIGAKSGKILEGESNDGVTGGTGALV